jgi:hypothetical protein
MHTSVLIRSSPCTMLRIRNARAGRDSAARRNRRRTRRAGARDAGQRSLQRGDLRVPCQARRSREAVAVGRHGPGAGHTLQGDEIRDYASKRALEESTLIAPTWLPSPALSAKRIFSVLPFLFRSAESSPQNSRRRNRRRYPAEPLRAHGFRVGDDGACRFLGLRSRCRPLSAVHRGAP